MSTPEKRSANADPTGVSAPASPSTCSEASNAPIDPPSERRLLRKLDLTIFPNASIQGLTAELHLDQGNRFNVALFAYYASYMLLRFVRPSLYLSTLMFLWGVVNMSLGFVHSYAALVTLRVLLGVFEAGVLPGIVYVTPMYYKRHEYQRRVSFFFCSIVVAGAFGGLLAYAVAGLGREGMAAWGWIFIVEGAATSGLAVLAVFVIVDWPEQARFPNKEEKALLRRRIATDAVGGSDRCRMDTLNGFAPTRIVTDHKIWLAAFMYMGVSVAGLSGTFFLPTILLEFQWRAQEAQVRTIPVYVFAAGMMLLGAWASDKLRHRSGFILGGASLATVGYAMLLAQEGRSRDYKFAAVFLVFWNNVSGHWKRSFAAPMQVTIGNFAGIIGAFIFIKTEAPTYKTGYGVALGMMWFGALCCAAMAGLMWRENRKRERGERDQRLARLAEQDKENMGDWHPSFRFTL